MRAHEHVPAEALRRLHGDHVRAPGRAGNDARGVHRLEGIGDGQDGNNGTRARAHRIDDARRHLRRRQGASRIMHENDVTLIALTQGSQTQGD